LTALTVFTLFALLTVFVIVFLDAVLRRTAVFLTAVCSLFTSASAGLASIPAGWTAAGLSVLAVDSLAAVSAPSVWSAEAALRLRVGLSDIECFHRE